MTKISSTLSPKTEKPNEAKDRASLATGGIFGSVCVINDMWARKSESVDPAALRAALEDQATAIHRGELEQVETMLLAQSCALESIFMELTRRAASNFGTNTDAAERYMRMALKAQSQCRANLETLANIKRPPTLFATQANITSGPQQVNNGTNQAAPSRTSRAQRKSKSGSNKLLVEAGHGSKAMDTRAKGKSKAGDPTLAAMVPIHRTAE